MAANDAAALASVARRYREFAVSDDEVRSIRVPILALLGSRDSFRPEVEALKQRMPSLQVRIVKDADHISVLERPESLEILDSFLN
jgi:pimeloyl-ACP methyl ester carboxylesterase